MSRLRHPSALLLASALTLGALATPVAAYADDATGTTQITVDDAWTALNAAKTATDAQAEEGWASQTTDTQPDGTVATADVAYDAVDGRGTLTGHDDGMAMQLIVTNHDGAYETVQSYRAGMPAQRFERALRMVGRPGATWVYEPAASAVPAESTYLDFGLPSMGPGFLLGILTDASQATIIGKPTRTVAADGSTTYDVDVKLIGGGSVDRGTMTVTVGSDGVLTADGSDFDGDQTSSTYAYGPQDVTLPAPGDVVPEAKVDEALDLLDMRSDARTIADEAAAQATKGRHPHASVTQVIRQTALSDARTMNRMYGAKVFQTRAATKGARIVATNPFTHQRVVFIVRAAGQRAVVRRG